MNEATAKTMTYVGGGDAILFRWDANTIVAIIGAVIGVGWLWC
jgi:hypothetical protein